MGTLEAQLMNEEACSSTAYTTVGGPLAPTVPLTRQQALSITQNSDFLYLYTTLSYYYVLSYRQCCWNCCGGDSWSDCAICSSPRHHLCCCWLLHCTCFIRALTQNCYNHHTTCYSPSNLSARLLPDLPSSWD